MGSTTSSWRLRVLTPCWLHVDHLGVALQVGGLKAMITPHCDALNRLPVAVEGSFLSLVNTCSPNTEHCSWWSHFSCVFKLIIIWLFVKWYGTSWNCSVVYKAQDNRNCKIAVKYNELIPMNLQSVNSTMLGELQWQPPHPWQMKHCQIVPYYFQCLYQNTEDYSYNGITIIH